MQNKPSPESENIDATQIKISLGFYLLINLLTFGLANLISNGVLIMLGRSYPSLLIASCIAVVLAYFISRQNSINATTQVPQLLWKMIEYVVVFYFLVLMYWFAVNSIHYNKEHITIFLVLNTVLLFVFNYFYIRYLRSNSNELPATQTIVLGENKFALQFIKSIQTNDWLGFNFKEQFVPKDFSKLDINAYLLDNDVQSIFINWDEFNLSKEREMLFRNLAEEHGVKFYAISEVFGSHLIPSAYNLAGNFPYIQLFCFPLDKDINATSKRLFDIFFSLMFLLFIASWLFPIMALITWLDSGLPIFFKQRRHGMDNQEFDCYKFRSMVINRESNHRITVKNDPRITKFGNIIRKTSLDELPQFWNVLIGDMSIVGPRPHMVNQNNHYNQIISKYNFRHYVKPGITGLAQVDGFRGEIKEKKDMENRIQSDLYYIRNWSFGLDLMIIYRTVANMVRGDENAI